MRKRNFDLLLIVFVLMFFVSNTEMVRAQDVSSMSISEIDALLSQEINLDVSFSGNPGVSGIEFWINYDKDVLTYTGFSDGNITGWSDDKDSESFTQGKVHLMWWSNNTINSSNGVILSMNFTVSDNASGGRTEITVSDPEFTGITDEDEVNFAVNNGSVTVKSVIASAFSIAPVYDGQPHGINVTVSEPADPALYTIEYSGDGETFSNEMPTVTNVNADPLTVYYKVMADGYAPATGSATVTIIPKTITAISGLKAEPKEYDGNASATLSDNINPVFEGIVDGDFLSLSTDSADYSAVFTDKNAGDNKVVTFSGLGITGESAGNYVLSDAAKTLTVTGTITKKELRVEGLAVEEKVYDGTKTATINTSGVSFPGMIEGEDLSISGTAEFETPDGGENKTVKYFELTLGGDDAKNYALEPYEVITTNGKVTPRPITITAKPQTVPLNGYIDEDVSNVEVISSYNPAIVSIDNLSGVTLTATDTAAATTSGSITPSAAVIIIDAETTAQSYAITYVSGTLTVTKADPEVIAPVAIEDLIYSGTAQDLVTAGSTTGGEMQYSLDGSTWNTAVPTGTNVQEYTVYYKVAGGDNYNDVAAQSISVSIGKAPLTVTANPKTITYGDAPANDGVSYEGFVNSESESVLSGTLAYTYDYSQYGNVGSYAITPAGLTSDNYEIEFKPGTLTVEQKEAGLNWSDTALTFNGSEQSPTATLTGTVNGDAVTVTVSGGQTDAGADYAATASGLTGDKAGNYKLPAETTQSFSIAKAAAPTLAAIPKNEIYNATSLSISIVSAGMPDNAGELAYSTDGEASKTGSVTVSGFAVDENGVVTATLSGGALNDTITLPVKISSTNYEDSTVNVVVTLVDKTDAGVTISGHASLTRTYGDEAFTLTAAVTDAGSNGAWQWISSDTSKAEVTSGNAESTVMIKAVSDTAVTIKAEYSSDTTKGAAEITLTVNPKEITVSGITAQNKVYDGTKTAALDLSAATLTGKVGNDDLSVTVSGAFENKTAGTGKTVNLSGLALSGTAAANYVLAAEGQQTTTTADITQKEITVSGITATDRDYEAGNTSVSLTGGTVAAEDIISGDTVTVDLSGATGTIETADAGTGKAVTVSGVKLGGDDGANYKLTAQPTEVTVTINKIEWTNTTAYGSAKYGSSGSIDLTELIAANGTVGTVIVTDADAILEGTPSVSGETLNYQIKSDSNLIGKTASIQVPVSGATNYSDYAITVNVEVRDKNTQTISASDITLAYGETKLIGASLTVGDGALSYAVSAGSEFAEVSADGNVTGLQVGSATVTITAAETTDYKATTKDVTVTVNKADIADSDITVPAVISGLVYNGEPQALITAGNASSVGTMQYALGTNDASDGSWTNTIPIGTNAGSYTVWYRVEGDANHNDTTPNSIEVMIAGKGITFSAEGYTGIHDDEVHGITVAVTDPAEGAVIYYGTAEGNCNLTECPKYGIPGTYPVWYQITAANYETVTGSQTVVIQPKTFTVTWRNWDGTVLETDLEVPEETIPSYNGETPVKSESEGETYFFNGWDQEVKAVTGDITYTAVFGNTSKTFTVTWMNWDGKVLETDENVPYGTTPVYDGSVPEKASADGYTFTFSGWTPEVSVVTKDTAYTAAFGANEILYHVTVTSNGNGNAEASVESGSKDTTVTLNAKSNDGYQFKEWQVVSGGVTPADKTKAETTFTIGLENVEIRAVFASAYMEVPVDPDDHETVGGDHAYVLGSNQPIKFRISRVESSGNDTAYSRFEKALNKPNGGIKLKFGGIEYIPVLHRDYDYAEGSVIIILYPEYLETLPKGEYTLETYFEEDSGNVLPYEVTLSVTEPKAVKFINVKSDGSYNTPSDIKEDTYDLTIRIFQDDKVLSEAANIKLEISKDTKEFSLETVQFKVVNEESADGSVYQIDVTGLPKEVYGYDTIYDGDKGADIEQITNKYILSIKEARFMPSGEIVIYLLWDDGVDHSPEPEWFVALPEDEIGAYALNEDGTKEYLLFHTYDICMAWLGSDELCRGYERCFHKENAYVNPFVKP